MNRGTRADNSVFTGTFNTSGREGVREEERFTIRQFRFLDGDGDIWVVIYLGERRSDSDVYRSDTIMGWRLGSMADTLCIRSQLCEELLPDDKGYA